MSFLDSQMVQKEMDDIRKLQSKIISDIPKFETMDVEEKLCHVNLLEELLEKQRIFYTRVSLSNDPDALKIKEDIKDSAKILGFNTNLNVLDAYDSMRKTVDRIKESIKLKNK